jgi:hypothetical protein
MNATVYFGVIYGGGVRAVGVFPILHHMKLYQIGNDGFPLTNDHF